MKVDESGGIWMKVDESGRKWMKVESSLQTDLKTEIGVWRSTSFKAKKNLKFYFGFSASNNPACPVNPAQKKLRIKKQKKPQKKCKKKQSCFWLSS